MYYFITWRTHFSNCWCKNGLLNCVPVTYQEIFWGVQVHFKWITILSPSLTMNVSCTDNLRYITHNISPSYRIQTVNGPKHLSFSCILLDFTKMKMIADISPFRYGRKSIIISKNKNSVLARCWKWTEHYFDAAKSKKYYSRVHRNGECMWYVHIFNIFKL